MLEKINPPNPNDHLADLVDEGEGLDPMVVLQWIYEGDVKKFQTLGTFRTLFIVDALGSATFAQALEA